MWCMCVCVVARAACVEIDAGAQPLVFAFKFFVCVKFEPDVDGDPPSSLSLTVWPLKIIGLFCKRDL